MKKIAILVNEDTMQRCTSGGCVNALLKKIDSFARYEGEEIEFVGLTHSGGDLEHKLAQLKKKGVDTIHLSSCTRSKNPDYEAIARRCAEDFNVVGYTHGSEVSAKTGAPAIILSKVGGTEE